MTLKIFHDELKEIYHGKNKIFKVLLITHLFDKLFRSSFIYEHLKQKQTKIGGFHNIFFVHFENFTKIKTFKHKSLKIPLSLNLPIGHARFHK